MKMTMFLMIVNQSRHRLNEKTKLRVLLCNRLTCLEFASNMETDRSKNNEKPFLGSFYGEQTQIR